jgi:glycerol-3-phosphate O-acyltransferase
LESLIQTGARVYLPREDLDYAIEVGLRMLTLRRLVHEGPTGIFPAPGEEPLLQYYANAIEHLVGDEATSSA